MFRTLDEISNDPMGIPVGAILRLPQRQGHWGVVVTALSETYEVRLKDGSTIWVHWSEVDERTTPPADHWTRKVVV